MLSLGGDVKLVEMLGSHDVTSSQHALLTFVALAALANMCNSVCCFSLINCH